MSSAKHNEQGQLVFSFPPESRGSAEERLICMLQGDWKVSMCACVCLSVCMPAFDVFCIPCVYRILYMCTDKGACTQSQQALISIVSRLQIVMDVSSELSKSQTILLLI